VSTNDLHSDDLDENVPPSPMDRALGPNPGDLTAERLDEKPRRARWLPNPEQVWRSALIMAAATLLVWLIAWPVGTTMAEMENTGLFRLRFGYSGAVVILAITNAGLILAGGYLLRASLRLEATADRLGAAVQSIEPNLRAETLKDDVALIDGEIDRALGKLATAEQQIRDQVGAIDAVTTTMAQGSGHASTRLAEERKALIEATSAMNAEAEAFADALTKRAQQARDEASAAMPVLDEKVERLEKVSTESAEQFEALRQAMAENLALLKEQPGSMATELKDGAASLREAQQALLEESQKLRTLIDQQKNRADSLGKTLAEQSVRLNKKRELTNNLGSTWKGILNRVETKPAPVTNAVPITDEERRRLDRLQKFTLAARAQLYGSPAPSEVQQFEEGDRQVFLRDLLARDSEETKARLKLAFDADAPFADQAENFLTDFDQLLAPVMDGEPEATEAALSDMLRSPLGQLYVLTGTAKGHFAA